MWISARPPSRGQWYHGLIELEVTFLKILQYHLKLSVLAIGTRGAMAVGYIASTGLKERLIKKPIYNPSKTPTEPIASFRL